MKITIQPNLGQTDTDVIPMPDFGNQPLAGGQLPQEDLGGNASKNAKFMRSLTRAVQQYGQALKGMLTLGDNIVGQFNTFDVKTLPSYTTNINYWSPVVIPWNFASVSAPNTVVVGQIIQPSSQHVRLTGSTVDWVYNPINQTITINDITGLQANHQYSITVEIK